MKAIIKNDKRMLSERDKIKDDMWNKMLIEGKFTYKQQQMISHYLTEIINMNNREIMSACHIAWMLADIEELNVGTGKNSTKLTRTYKSACEYLDEGYGHDCINANGFTGYDGCGLEHLRCKLKGYGVDFEV